MKKIIVFTLVVISTLMITGCTSDSNVIKEINYSELEEKIDNKENFILEVVQTGCSHCEEFSPRFKAMLKEEKKEAYSLNLYNLKEDELKKFNKLTTSVSGTPTVLYYKEGKETNNRIYGAVSNEKIKEFLEKID